jgi:hypothetical protein
MGGGGSSSSRRSISSSRRRRSSTSSNSSLVAAFPRLAETCEMALLEEWVRAGGKKEGGGGGMGKGGVNGEGGVGIGPDSAGPGATHVTDEGVGGRVRGEVCKARTT